jgi:DNA-directed RNA polymerase specialized sigma24 family protein
MRIVPHEAFDEGQVRLLLGGSPEEVRRGVALIQVHLSVHFCRRLRRRFPGLSPEDAADVWGETLVSVLGAAGRGRFDPGRPLLPWLSRIALARTVDHTRSLTARRRVLAAAWPLLSCEAGPHGPLPQEVEAGEVRALLHRFLPTLPGRQGLVLGAFVDHYPEATRMEVLRREVSRLTGTEESLAAVKRALQEGRLKARAFLEEMGYGPEGAD